MKAERTGSRRRGGRERWEGGKEIRLVLTLDKTLASPAVWTLAGQGTHTTVGTPEANKRQKATQKNKKRALSSQLGLPTATIESGTSLPC